MIIILPETGVIAKTIEVNQSQTVNGITFTLQSVELSATGMTVTAFNTPPGYNLPQGPMLAPPSLMELHATASYSIDGGASIFIGSSGISFLDSGMRHVWTSNMPVPKGAKKLTFTIATLGTLSGPWTFNVPLE
jgi:hypothetical protein